MGHIIAYIISSIIASWISGFLLLGIPVGVLLEMKGLGDYMYALTVVLASLFSLIWFIITASISGDVDLSIKGIFSKIKSLFKKDKNKEEKKNAKEEIKNNSSKLRYIIEGVIIIAIAIYSIIFPQHSSIAKVIYNGTIIKALSSIFLPLVIINIINEIIDLGGFSSILSSIGTQLGMALAFLVIGFIISTGMLFTASVFYKDIETSIRKEWFIYDNPNFDEIRGKDFDATKYLEKEYKDLTEKVTETLKCDTTEEACMDKIKLEVVRALDHKNGVIRNYGYMYKSKIKVDANVDVLCITDMKTRNNLFYEINYKDFSFKEITIDDYNKYAKQG